MSDIFTDLIKEIDQFEANLDSLIIDLAIDQEPLIIELNTEEQMFQGIRSNKTPILNQRGRGYTPYTVKIKRRKGQPTDRVTLKDTGDFYKSLKVDRSAFDELEISATDSKTGKILKKYGEKVIGLTDDHIEEVSEAMRDPLLMEYKKLAQ